MKILLVEDHSIVRYGVVRILMGMSPGLSVDECENFDDGLKLLGKTTYDLIIVDINVPHGGNIEMIRLIRLKQPAIKILIFSASDEKIYALRYLREGADGYLMKDSPKQEFIDAVRSIVNNGKYVSANIRQQMLHSLNQNEKSAGNPMMSLSNREIEVTELLIQGRSIGEIAKIMNLHVSTISTYKMRIFKKFDVTNVIDLAEKRKRL